MYINVRMKPAVPFSPEREGEPNNKILNLARPWRIHSRKCLDTFVGLSQLPSSSSSLFMCCLLHFLSLPPPPPPRPLAFTVVTYLFHEEERPQTNIVWSFQLFVSIEFRFISVKLASCLQFIYQFLIQSTRTFHQLSLHMEENSISIYLRTVTTFASSSQYHRNPQTLVICTNLLELRIKIVLN